MQHESYEGSQISQMKLNVIIKELLITDITNIVVVVTCNRKTIPLTAL
jgi:hypothetical protein